MTTYLNPGNLPYPSVGMNPGVAVGDLVFANGMAFDFDTMARSADADTVAAETRICLGAIEAILVEAGCTIRDIAKTTCYLSDDADRREFWEAYTEFFGDGPFPARSTFVVGIAGGCRVEIDAIAVRAPS